MGKHGRPNALRALLDWAMASTIDPPRPYYFDELVKWVELVTNIEHLLTRDATSAGTPGAGGYITLCGADIIPGAMVEPGRKRCQDCLAHVIPGQRRGPRR